ncbi:hypothetical protein SteCoe_28090 [Stentor coeruleus]|uniref:Uncharacterized protein n=1 Tax=Stentor coeruleus TaxID=5963 RepID=A0A1R2B902_9CILI|nr:hypothetical protein SteCoe_28090 [Stentor coeruleus]
MWKCAYEVRVIRFEGIETFTNCEVLLNENTLETLFPILSDKSFIVNSNGKYQILLSQGEEKYSVSFSIHLFEDDGMVWLPMFYKSYDYLLEQPEEVYEPRVLLLVHKREMEEIYSAIVTEESGMDQDLMPEIKLNYEENTMIIYEDKDEPSFNESSKLDCNHTEEHIETSKGPIDTEICTQINDKTEDKLLEISISFQESLTKQKQYTDKILEEVEEKNKELSLALSQILGLKAQITRFEIENSYLKSLNNGLIGTQISELLVELETYKKKIEELENKRSESRTSVIKERSEELIERALRAECEKMNISILNKEPEEVYTINGKKFNILLRNGKLQCRVGNIYKDLRTCIEDPNSEAKQIVHNNYPKSPLRKNLAELNSSIETPRTTSKLGENALTVKPRQSKRPSQSLKRQAKPLKKHM